MSSKRIGSREVSVLLNTSTDGVRKMRERGALKKVELDDSQHPPKYWYDRAEVEALRKQRLEAGEQSDEFNPSPLTTEYLRSLWNQGGLVVAEDGRATKLIRDRMRVAYSSITSGASELLAAGLIVTDTNGKRTFRIALTEAGMAWCREHFGDPVPYVPEPEEEPEPVPQQLAVIEEASNTNGDVGRTVVSPPTQAPEAPAPGAPPSSPVPEQGADLDGLARALLRQATRVLSDSELSTVAAERDALREHNAVLSERVAMLTSERDRYASEAREAREVLHQIEMQLTPLLAGPEARFDWLDAHTRTDLIRLVSEAARWAAT